METHEYRVMFDMETNYWWYVGLHQIVLHFLRRENCGNGPLNVLDAGCGTGQLMKLCQADGLNPMGLDFSGEALRFFEFVAFDLWFRAPYPRSRSETTCSTWLCLWTSPIAWKGMKWFTPFLKWVEFLSLAAP